MSEAKITWKAFGDKPEQGRFISSVVVEVPEQFVGDLQICEAIYKVTNLQSDLEDFGASIAEGRLWKRIESELSATRTHTSLSVGDEIEIGGQVYICADFGFEKIENVEIQYIGDSIFSVRSKVVA